MAGYAHPEVLVDSHWVADHLQDPNVRIIDTHIDPTTYEAGHIPGAVFWNGFTTILQPDLHVSFSTTAVEELLSRSGITPTTTVVAYSDHPAIAPWVFWFFRTFGHQDVRVLNGGRKKWLAEGRPLTTEVPVITPAAYPVPNPDPSLRVLLDDVRAAIHNQAQTLIDTRTPQEYRGEWFMLEPPQGSERAGHIPGARHIYYESALNTDGTFKSAEELSAFYTGQGVSPTQDVITYCAIGIRAAHTWFVLKYLLGYPQVRSYDASWNEWGRLPDTPIEK
ncbi:MAG: sulfurtransferase [Candidatus Binatia bacterium]